MIGDVRRSRHCVRQRGDEPDAAHPVEVPAFPEPLGQRHQIHGLMVGGELPDGLEYNAVSLPVEVIRPEDLLSLLDSLLLYEHCTQDCLLRLYVLRGFPFLHGSDAPFFRFILF